MSLIIPTTPTPPRRFVETLRKRGLKVRVVHHRYVQSPGFYPEPVLTAIPKHSGYGERIESRGGLTHVGVRLPDGREFIGEARCSTEDTYNRRVGVWLAVKRALGQAKLVSAMNRLHAQHQRGVTD